MTHVRDNAECPAWQHLHDGCPGILELAGLAAAAEGLQAALAGLVATEAAARSKQAEKNRPPIVIVTENQCFRETNCQRTYSQSDQDSKN